MKRILLTASIVSFLAVSCGNNNQETNTEIVKDTAVTLTPQSPVKDTVTKDETIKYVSNDNKTNFTVTYNAGAGTALVKNETTGKTYDMKRAVSGSGAKYEDANGNFFWEHQGEFNFGNGDKTEIQGKPVN